LIFEQYDSLIIEGILLLSQNIEARFQE